MRFAIIYPNLDGTPHSLDMGVAYLATYIDERTDHQVKIIDPTFHTRHWRDYMRKQVESFNPDVVGISVVSLYFDYARIIARFVKTIRPVPIIVGGYHTMMNPDETAAVPDFDAICTGEGEHTLAEYLDRLSSGDDLQAVKGLWFKDGGVLVKNEKRPFNDDLDSLPIPNYNLFDDIDNYLYYLGRLYVIGTRGCPYRCSFCAESVLDSSNPGRRYRERDPKNYVAEIEYLYRTYRNRGMKAAHVYDAVFTFNGSWFREWAEEYQKRGLHEVLPYTTFLKADQRNASEEKLRLLAESGCLQVRIGLESADQGIREEVLNKKGNSPEITREILNTCNRYGMIVKTYCMIGIPGDTLSSIRKTYEFSKTPLIHVPLYFAYTPLPSTPLAERFQSVHRTGGTERIYSYHFSRGAKNEGVPSWYVPWTLIKSYVYYGTRLAWNIFLSNPVIFIPLMLSRIIKGLVFGAPPMISAGYALIHPGFWPGLSRLIRKRWLRSRFRK